MSDIVKLMTRTKPAERFWAKPLQDGTFEVRNVLISTDNYTLGDIVSATRNGFVNKVVDRRWRGVCFDFHPILKEEAPEFMVWLQEQLGESPTSLWEGLRWPYMACVIPIEEDRTLFEARVGSLFHQWLEER